MKFVCRGLDLSEAISKVTKALPAKAVENPLLSCIKVDAYEDVLTLFATDGELAIMKKINAEIIEEGSTAIPGAFLTEFVRRLSDEQMEFTLSDKNTMQIKYTDSEVMVQCFESREYPTFRELMNPKKITILQKDLKELVFGTAFCVSADSSRGSLRGCKLEVDGNRISSVALDGFRLMKMSKELTGGDGAFNAVVPGKSLSEVAKVIEDDDNKAEISFENEYVLFDFGHTRILARTLGSEFINYEQIIPREFGTEIVVNREMLLKSLDRIAILGRSDVKTSMVKITAQDNTMVLKGNSKLGNITENLSVSFSGKDLRIAFNVKYLMEFLGNVKDEFVKMKFSSSIAPCLITPTTEDSDYFYLVLPVRITE